MTRLKLAAGWVGVQLLFFAGWTVREHQRVASAPSILVKVVPVDPRDLLRGQYLSLATSSAAPGTRRRPASSSPAARQSGSCCGVTVRFMSQNDCRSCALRHSILMK